MVLAQLVVNARLFSHKNLVKIHKRQEELHKDYYEDDKLDQVKLDLIDPW